MFASSLVYGFWILGFIGLFIVWLSGLLGNNFDDLSGFLIQRYIGP